MIKQIIVLVVALAVFGFGLYKLYGKGFMEGMVARNKFRFIEKTKQISDYRGDRVDDGIIR